MRSFRSEGIEIIRTPIGAPQANAFAERFVGTVRRDCLDWLVIVNRRRRQLERTLRTYIQHYNHHRPHRALDLRAPAPRTAVPTHSPPAETIKRREQLGGLLHEYAVAA